MLEFIQIPKEKFDRSGITSYSGTSFIVLGRGDFCLFDSLTYMNILEANYVEKHGLVYINVEEPVFYA